MDDAVIAKVQFAPEQSDGRKKSPGLFILTIDVVYINRDNRNIDLQPIKKDIGLIKRVLKKRLLHTEIIFMI